MVAVMMTPVVFQTMSHPHHDRQLPTAPTRDKQWHVSVSARRFVPRWKILNFEGLRPWWLRNYIAFQFVSESAIRLGGFESYSSVTK